MAPHKLAGRLTGRPARIWLFWFQRGSASLTAPLMLLLRPDVGLGQGGLGSDVAEWIHRVDVRHRVRRGSVLRPSHPAAGTAGP